MNQNTTHLPITGLPVGGVPPAVLVCGDPERATLTADLFNEASLLSERREYRAYRGMVAGMPVAVCSHGIGAPGAAIAFEELVAAGARRLIRIGTCGAMQPGMVAGDLVVATAAVDRTGYGRLTVPDGYPAVASVRLTSALLDAAAEQGHAVRSGIVLTNDSFYPGVETPHATPYPVLSAAGVVAVEMECAALFVTGSLRVVQTAAILAVDGNVLEQRESMETYDPHREAVSAAVEAEIAIALLALQRSAGDR
ncbi:MAG: nucleoside phosphorylase [Anaerolineae bacterium]|nr:nucleoside phosphorylase [Anaerolineae bacterium]